MRVLITGATGLLGHAVAHALAGRGHEVITLSRGGGDVPDASTTHLTADVRSADDMRAAVADVDAVCHLAALVRVRDSIAEPLEYWRTNVVGTLNVLDALLATATPKRLILASTGAVYGTPARQPIAEDEVTAPANPYAATKLAADMAAAHTAAAGTLLGATSLRAFNIAGASAGRTDRDLTRLIPKALAVHAGKAGDLTVNGEGTAIRDFVHVDDMADAFVRALDACVPGTWQAYNIGSGRRTTVLEVLETTAAVTGKPVPIRHAPPAPEPAELVADASKARAELGWQPTRSDLTTIITDAWRVMNGA